MQALQDQSNTQIIRNYVAMPDRMQFSAVEVIRATGVCPQTVRNVLRLMELNGEITRGSKRVGRRVYYRQTGESEKLIAEAAIKPVQQIARERGVSKEAVYQKLRPFMLPKELRATDNEYKVLELVSQGKEPVGYYRTMERMDKKGWIEYNTRLGDASESAYTLTAQGREVLNAKSTVR